MKKQTKIILVSIWSLLILIPMVSLAAPVLVNRLNNDHIEPLIKTDFFKGAYFTATSTTASSTFSNGLNLTSGCLAYDGTCISTSGTATTFATTTEITAMSSISAWGDSLTFGTGVSAPGKTYPEQLSIYLNFPVINVSSNGYAGQGSTVIANNFLTATGINRNEFLIIWSGNNGATNQGASSTSAGSGHTPYDIDRMLAVTKTPTKYLVLSLHNNAADVAGSANYQAVMSVNTVLASRYAGHYYDSRADLLSSCNAPGPTNTTGWYASTTQDQIDCLTNDVVPTSLRFDAIHLNDVGYNIIAKGIASYINTNIGVGTKAINYGDVAYIAQQSNDTYASSTKVNFFTGTKSRFVQSSTGLQNVGVGPYAFSGLTSGSYNTGVGRSALEHLTTGSYNTAFGDISNWSLVTGSGNTSVGYFALGRSTANNNTGVGSNSGYGVTSGINNACFGANCMAGGTITGNHNTGIGGIDSAYSLTTGSDNIAIGTYAGFGDIENGTTFVNELTTGSRNTFVGNSTYFYNDVQYNGTFALGYRARPGCSNCGVLGGTGADAVNVGIGTSTPWRALSVTGSSDLGSNALAGYFTATSTSVASTFPYASSTALTVSGNTYLGTTNLTGITGIAGNCLHVDTNGLISGMGADCGTAGGEANTASSLGTGLNIYDSKSAIDLRFNTLAAGTNITLSTSTNNNTIVINSTATGGGSGTVSTSTNETAGALSYWTSNSATPALLGKVATTSLTATSPLVLSNPISVIGASASAVSMPAAATAQNGYLTSTDWTTFNGKADTTSAMTGTFDGVDFTNGTLAQNALWFGGAAAAPSELTIGTGGFILGVSGGAPAWIATTTIPLAGDVGGTLSSTVLATVNSNVGSFTNANITVNGKGLITAASNGSAGGGSAVIGGFTQLATTTSMSIDICDTAYATSSINALGVGTSNIAVTMSGSGCLGKQIFIDVWAPQTGLIGTTTFSGVYWNGQINPGSAVINGLTDRFMFAVTASSTTFITAKFDSSY